MRRTSSFSDSDWVPFLLAVLVLFFVLIVGAVANRAYGADVVTPPLQHGHLVPLPYWVDAEGRVWSAHDTAFLAVKLDPTTYTTDEPRAIDYTQETNVHAQHAYPTGVTISRAQWTNAATSDGWIILPLTKPCVARASGVSVGTITVCPARRQSADGRTYIDACTIPAISGVQPIFAGVPPETVECKPSRRRSVR